MNKKIAKVIICWILLLPVFFLVSGGNIHISEWSEDLRNSLGISMLAAAGYILLIPKL